MTKTHSAFLWPRHEQVFAANCLRVFIADINQVGWAAHAQETSDSPKASRQGFGYCFLSLSFFLYNCIYLVIYFLAVLCLRTLFLPGFEPGTFCM